MADDTSSAHDTSGIGSTNPLGDLLSLLGGINPVPVLVNLAQSVATLNDTMKELNRAVRRVNDLLDDVEGPIRDMVPVAAQVAKQAKTTIKKVDGVVGSIGTLPADVARAVGTLGDLASRLGPLAAFAETAGGLFGVRNPQAQ